MSEHSTNRNLKLINSYLNIAIQELCNLIGRGPFRPNQIKNFQINFYLTAIYLHKQNIKLIDLIALETYVCVLGGKKYLFLENLACFVFLKHPFSYSLFCLITNDIADFRIPKFHWPRASLITSN